MSKFIISTADPSFIKNLASNLLNNIGTYTKGITELEDTRIFERKSLEFRDIVDTVFPSMLIIDFNNIENELKKYNDIIKSLKDIFGSEYSPTEKTRNFTSKLSSSEISLILSAIKHAAALLPGITANSKVLQKKLELLSSSDIDKDKISSVTIKKFKEIFNNTYHLEDLSSTNRHVFVFPTFSILTSEMAAAIHTGTDIAIEEASLNNQAIAAEQLEDLGIGKLLNYGHTATGYLDEKGNTIVNFSSPKIIQILYDVLADAQKYSVTAREKALQLVNSFIETSKQVEEFVEIEKDFSNDFMRIFVRYGGNTVKFENTLINQLRGSRLEKSKQGINKVVLAKLAQEFKSAGRSSLGVQIQANILKGRGSPSFTDYLMYSTINTYENKKVDSFKNITSAKRTNKTKIKIPIVSGLIKNIAKIPTKSKVILQQNKSLSFNLTSLQSLLNSNLHDRIKANMGTGDSRNILNYRTGRFAESAKVEKVTESRAGMITAFYTYMKNPYATFSEGGRQSSPRTRDPKLLIAKSIREIAATKVANRLRAVSL